MKIDQDLPKMDQWSCHALGSYLLDVERRVMSDILADFFGYHIVQIGGPTQDHYIADSSIRHKIRITVEQCDSFQGNNIQADLYELPLVPESIDVIVLPHVLEFVEEPVSVLQSCYESLAAGGHLVILSFNPYSLVGLAKLLGRNDRVFRRSTFIKPYTMRKYLHLAHFDVEDYKSMCYRLPLKNKKWFDRLKMIEPIGRFIWPSLGGVYVIVAQKKVVPLNLIGAIKTSKVKEPKSSIEPTLTRLKTDETWDQK